MAPATHDVKALLAHIEKLEKRLQYYERYHQCCPHIVALSPPADEESDLDDDLSGLKVIPFSVKDLQPSKPHNSNQPWRKIADQLLNDDVSFIKELTLRTAEFGLNKATDLNNLIIADICSTSANVTALNSLIIAGTYGATAQDPLEVHQEQANIIEIAQGYAQKTKYSRGNVKFYDELQTFRELIFVSFCAVLENVGESVQEINGAMRILLSNSNDVHLKRMRRGAIWANQRIAVLGDNATEWFFIRMYVAIVVNNSHLTIE
jgi:hypothetical protein